MDLELKARQLRQDILKMLTCAGSGHTGGCLSCVEILISLYYYKLRHNPLDHNWEDRDRFVFSKGHGAPTLYAILADLGYFPREELFRLRKLGSILQGHPDYLRTPGIDASTGSLGQGLSIACGMALASRLSKRQIRIYCLLGDGELDEGQVWEAMMTANQYNLDNLCAIIDWNLLQIDGFTREVKTLEPIKERFASFGWNVLRVDGHNIAQLKSALDQAEKLSHSPTVIIAHTVKGKGVSFIENKVNWHGIAPRNEDLEKALREL